jgi:lipopolysaccharide heptosyltransferase II
MPYSHACRCYSSRKMVPCLSADMQGLLHTTLVIRLSSVGDIVLTSPLLRALRARFPDTTIDVLVKSSYVGLVRHNPHVTRVIEFPDRGTLIDALAVRQEILERPYDLVVDAHDSLRSRVLTAGMRNVVRINKRKIPRTFLVHGKVDLYARFGGSPDVPARCIEPVAHLGVTDDGLPPEVFFPPEMSETVAVMLEGEGIPRDARVLGLCPSSRHINKRWPAERYAEAAAQIAGALNVPVVIFGSAEERTQSVGIVELIRRLSPAVKVANLAGWLTLAETAAAIDRCAVVITNDTGLMHIASARSRPLVAIFGPTVKQFGFFPRGGASRVLETQGLACRPCTHIGLPYCPQKHFTCMNSITVASVVREALALTGRA